MGIFTEVLIAVLAAIGTGTVAWLIWGITVLPIKGYRGRRLTVVLPAGNAEEITRAAEGLIYLERMGILDADVAISADGLDYEAMQAAERLMRQFRGTGLIITSSKREGKANGSDGKSD